VAERRLSPADRRIASRGGRRRADYAGRPTVLIIDDHVDSRELLATILQEIGVSVAEAGTGSEALIRVALSPPPSLILLDLSLPDCHGADIVQALRQRLPGREIPIVALTASVMPADRERAADAGCAAFLEKPVLPDDVIDVVRRLLACAEM
jgi:CheY-like chemotaxis protein